MSPKEKAQELSDRLSPFFEDWNGYNKFNFKQCALIAVNLLMEEAYRQHDYEGFIAYWKEVKQEIEKI